jgi:hypothetical protein
VGTVEGLADETIAGAFERDGRAGPWLASDGPPRGASIPSKKFAGPIVDATRSRSIRSEAPRTWWGDDLWIVTGR